MATTSAASTATAPAAAAAAAAAIIGSTGLVGSNLLSVALASDAYNPVHTITRRAPKQQQQQQAAATATNLHAVVDADTTTWATTLSSGLSPPPSTVFSALGTTRAAAGGIANQWKVDHDLNVELARAARAAGVTTYVFVSSAGTRSLVGRAAPYSRMKVGVEDAIRELAFEHAVILRPGWILGEREQPRAVEGLLQSALRQLARLHAGIQDTFGQEAPVIARAAWRAAQLAAEGKAPAKYWVVEAADIIRLGRTVYNAGAGGGGGDGKDGAGGGT